MFRPLLGLSLALAPLVANAAAKQPNIIFILCDDLGYGDVGAFFQNARKSKGLPAEVTPNLDKMADEGVQLRGLYCPAPVCAPSRASLISGVHQGHAGLRDNQFDKALENNHTLPGVLRQAGYSTALIGKWGMQGAANGGDGSEGEETASKDGPSGSPAQWPAYPTKRGFDYFFGYVRHGDGHEHYPKEGVYRGKKQVWDNTAEISAQLDKCYTTDLFTARAKKWIVDERKAHPEKPFFLELAFDTPHAVLELPTGAYPSGGGLEGGLQWTGKPGAMITSAKGSPDSYLYPEFANATYNGPLFSANPGKKQGPEASQVKSRPWPDVYKRYATSVRRIDDCVGDLLRLLKDLKIDDDTLVVFTTDNGPSQESYLKEAYNPNFFSAFGPFDGIKRDCWEGGVRVGAIVRAPGIIPAKRVDESPAQFHDWMTTFAQLAGIPAPARADGVSLLPALTGKGVRQPSTVYVEYAVAGNTPNYGEFEASRRGRKRGQMQLIRLGDMVGVRYDVKSHADAFEIYDVVKDPGESKDLAKDNPALQQTMKDAVVRLHRPNASAPRPYDREPVPAFGDVKTAPGLLRKSFAGNFPWVAKLDDGVPSKTEIVAAPGTDTAPEAGTGETLYTGYVEAPAEGAYTFALTEASGGLLRIDGAIVIDADFGHKPGATATGSILLKPGKHAIALYHRTGATPDVPKLEWTVPGGAREVIPAKAFSHESR